MKWNKANDESSMVFHLPDGQILTVEHLMQNALMVSSGNGSSISNEGQAIQFDRTIQIDGVHTTPTTSKWWKYKCFAVEYSRRNFTAEWEKLRKVSDWFRKPCALTVRIRKKSKAPPVNMGSSFKRIDTIDELNSFENKLKNPAFYNESVR